MSKQRCHKASKSREGQRDQTPISAKAWPRSALVSLPEALEVYLNTGGKSEVNAKAGYKDLNRVLRGHPVRFCLLTGTGEHSFAGVSLDRGGKLYLDPALVGDDDAEEQVWEMEVDFNISDADALERQAKKGVWLLLKTDFEEAIEKDLSRDTVNGDTSVISHELMVEILRSMGRGGIRRLAIMWMGNAAADKAKALDRDFPNGLEGKRGPKPKAGTGSFFDKLLKRFEAAISIAHKSGKDAQAPERDFERDPHYAAMIREARAVRAKAEAARAAGEHK